MHEILPGLWHWTTFHDGIRARVSSYAGATGSGTVSGSLSAYDTRTESGCSSNQYLQVTGLVYRGTVTVA